jgi:hypothetical protein
MKILISLALACLVLVLSGCSAPPENTPAEPQSEILPTPFILSDAKRAKYAADLFILLESESPEERKKAEDGLKQLTMPEHLAHLMSDLKNSDKRIAQAARDALAREGKTIKALERFEIPSLSEWNKARQELVELGPEALTAMVQLLTYKFMATDMVTQAWAREQISSSGKAVLKPAQAVLKSNKNAEIIRQLTLSIAEMGGIAEGTVKDIINSTDVSLTVSLTMIDSLGESGADYWIDKLGEMMLKASRWQVRAEAAMALGKFVDDRSYEYVIKGLDDSDDFVKQNSIKALGLIRDLACLPTLISLLDRNDKPELIDAAVVSLTQITGKRLGGRPEVWKRWWAENKNKYLEE